MGPALRAAGALAACLALSPAGVAAFPNATVGGTFSTNALKHIHSAKSLLDKLGSPPHMSPTAGTAGALFGKHRTAEEATAEKDLEEQAKKLMALAGFSMGKSLIKAVVPPLFKTLDSQRKARGAWCGLNAASAVEYFSRAGIMIAGSLQECAAKKAGNTRGSGNLYDAIMDPCSAQVSEILSSLIWAGAWLSMAASECSAHASWEAACAGVIQALIAAVAETMAAGDVMRETCMVPAEVPTNVAPFPVRRLQAGNPAYTPELAAFDAKTQMTQEALDLEMAMCVQDSVQAATMLAQFGVAYDNSIFVCPLKDFADIVENACVMEVSLTINRVLQAAAYVGGAISHCGKALGVRLGAECTASMLQVSANLAGIPAAAAGINLACPGTEASLVDTYGILAGPMMKLTSIGRRLEDNATAPMLV